MKKTLAAFLLILAMALTVFTGCQVSDDTEKGDTGVTDTAFDSAKTVFTVDINPGVRFYLAADETVIAAEGTNEDGETVVAEVEVEGLTADEAIDAVLDEAVEQGYVDESEPSVLVTVEKEETVTEDTTEDTTTEDVPAEGTTDTTAEDAPEEDTAKPEKLTDRLYKKIGKNLEKHGKKARIIAQKLEDKAIEELRELSEKYDISVGKANVIEKIRGEFPELDEEDLAGLDMSGLGLLLGETGEDVKEHFEKFEKALEETLIGKEAAIEKALLAVSTEELTVTADDVLYLEARLSREDGKMVYEVEFVLGETEYEFEIDAALGDILDREEEPVKEFDVDGEIDKFFDERPEIIEEMLGKLEEEKREELEGWREDGEKFRDEMIDAIFGKGEDKDDDGKTEGDFEQKPEEKPAHREPIGRTEAIAEALKLLGLDRDGVKETKVKFHDGERGMLISVKLETEDGDKYEVVIEAFSATVIRASKNGEAIEIVVETETPETPVTDTAETETAEGEGEDTTAADIAQ